MSAYDPDDWRTPPPPWMGFMLVVAFIVAIGFAAARWVLR